MGGANYHARIRFQDESPPWLLRVPRVTSFSVGFPARLADYLIRSEYATLKFLEDTDVPAPRAFSYGTSTDGANHGVGIAFLLMEELPGEPWNAQSATIEDKAKVWKQLAGIMEGLQRHPFPKAGSLCCEANMIEVSALASDRFVALDPQGPYPSAIAYYQAYAEQYMALIADRQLYTDYSVDAYLVYAFLKDSAAQMAELDGEDDTKQEFFLKHVDDKGDHILVDDDLNITGIIDWQMARVVPRREAFGPSLVTADMTALCNGHVSLSADDAALTDELRRAGLDKLHTNMIDERARRFFWGLALEPRWDDALPLAKAILEVFGVAQSWAEWREMALEKHHADSRLQNLL